MSAYRTSGSTKTTYKGETYVLECRHIWRSTGIERVWCWEIKTGYAAGWYGGHCRTKAEALAIVKRSINDANAAAF